MNMRFALIGLVAGAATVAVAEPEVRDVSVTQDGSRRVTVTYKLSEEAIVTLGVETNFVEGGETKWASIGEENYTNVGGDVNRLVSAGENRTISWKPNRSWPNRMVAAGGIRFVVNAWAKSNPPDYMVVRLDGSKIVNYYTSTNALPDGGLANDVYRTDRIVLRKCPAANVDWWMGAPSTEAGFEGGGVGKETRHKVTLLHDYYMAIYEATQGQVAKTGYPYVKPRFPVQGETRPFDNTWHGVIRGEKVGQTSWPNDDPAKAHAVDEWSILDYFRKATDVQFDLPTEAEWEFACRAGTSTGLNSGKDWTEQNLGEVARYYNNGGGNYSYIPTDSGPERGTGKVGSYRPNAWGIYDMHGNIPEICLDWYQDDLGSDAVTEPKGPATNADGYHVLRGGSYKDDKTQVCRSAARMADKPWVTAYLGFRVCVPVE